MNAHCHLSLRLVLLCSLGALGPSGLPAAQVVQSEFDLRIRHRTPVPTTAAADDKSVAATKDEPIRVKARHGEKVNLVIVDPNTLLFDYKIGKKTEVNTADYDALVTFAKSVRPDLSVAAAVDSEIKAGKSTVTYPAIRRHLKRVADAFVDIDAKVNASATNVHATGFPSKELLESVEKISGLVDLLRELEGATADDEQRIISVNNGGLKTATEFWNDPIGIKLRGLFDVRNRVEQLHKSVADFLADYKAYQKASAEFIRIASVTGDRQKVITQAFDVTARTAYRYNPDAKEQQTKAAGTFSVEVSPKQSFHLRGGVGAIYSFVKNPEYSVATAASGALTIAEKSADTNSLSAAATLNLYPDAWWGQPIEPFFQIGYSPASDTQGILGGIGFTGFKDVQFAGGIIYQQRRTLKAGQSVGMTLARAEDLGTKKEWATGFYVQVSIPVSFGKE